MKAAALPVVLAALALPARAQDAGPPFTAAQAEHGGEIFAGQCSSCHGAHLNDGEFGPSLKGARFVRNWGGKPVSALFAYMGKNMPPGQAGSLSPQDYADLAAFLLSSNGGKPGATALPADETALAAVKIPG